MRPEIFLLFTRRDKGWWLVLRSLGVACFSPFFSCLSDGAHDALAEFSFPFWKTKSLRASPLEPEGVRQGHAVSLFFPARARVFPFSPSGFDSSSCFFFKSTLNWRRRIDQAVPLFLFFPFCPVSARRTPLFGPFFPSAIISVT